MEKQEARKQVLEIKRRFFTGHPPKDPREVLAELRKMFGGGSGGSRRPRSGRDRAERGGLDRSED
ncbi:MAG: hypothetical protein ACYTAN_16825 [Planctomycetota bacterium]|jgi:hypothetical protein